jgi:exopolyphosphatase/guanosine-5'-triphosphate,3'-diphosphate pyrophosphatase
MKAAVIDLGTNTFHLLIADVDANGRWKQLYKERRYVKLAEDGIERIGEAAYARAIDAMAYYQKVLAAHDVPLSRVKATGTAAMRTASNAQALMADIAELFNINSEVIDGLREAGLIYKGVRQAMPWPNGRGLIMDIGGGSTEFILANEKEVLWQYSFPLGAGVLLNRFAPDDPISEQQIQSVEAYLNVEMQPLWDAIARYPTPALIGASGTFDVIDQFLLDPQTKPALYGQVNVEAYNGLAAQLIHSTRSERLAMPDLPDERIDMIVVAMLLIDIVLKKVDIKTIYTSTYALKEGLLAEIFAPQGQ